MSRALLASLVLAASTALAQDDALVEVPIHTTDAGYGFLVYTPPGYATSTGRHALVVFLHGAGEVGAGQGAELFDEMTLHGAAKLLRQGATVSTNDAGLREARGGSRLFANDDAIVIVPQSPAWWDAGKLNGFLTWVMHRYRVDPRRIYLTGISMGGGGTWDYTSGQGRDRLAAAWPVCGASGGGSGSRFAKTQVWAFHSWDDPTVPRSNSIAWISNIGDTLAGMNIGSVLTGYPHADGGVMAPATQTMTAYYGNGAFTWQPGSIADGGSPLRLTLYTDDSHDSWTRTYNNLGVWAWLFRQRSVVDPRLQNALVIDDLDDGFSADGGWQRLQPAAGGFYGWETLEANLNTQPSARFEATVPMAGLYHVYASGTGGSNRTVCAVDVQSASSASTLSWDQRDGGVASLGAVPLSGAVSLTVRPTAASGFLAADAIGLVYLGPIDAGVPPVDAGTTADAGTSTDAGMQPGDAGTHPSDAGNGKSDMVGSCGCTSTGAPLPFALLAIVALASRRRLGRLATPCTFSSPSSRT
jgi:MYXO-CTERM domain-containing protein